jgi:hypothetical protein
MFVCDFCSMSPAEFLYDADDFILDLGTPFVHFSDGGWAACKTCADLIDANDQTNLVNRGYQAWRRRGLPPGDALGLLSTIHSAFFASRKGGRKPLPKDPPTSPQGEQPEGQ